MQYITVKKIPEMQMYQDTSNEVYSRIKVHSTEVF